MKQSNNLPLDIFNYLQSIGYIPLNPILDNGDFKEYIVSKDIPMDSKIVCVFGKKRNNLLSTNQLFLTFYWDGNYGMCSINKNSDISILNNVPGLEHHIIDFTNNFF